MHEKPGTEKPHLAAIHTTVRAVVCRSATLWWDVLRELARWLPLPLAHDLPFRVSGRQQTSTDIVHSAPRSKPTGPFYLRRLNQEPPAILGTAGTAALAGKPTTSGDRMEGRLFGQVGAFFTQGPLPKGGLDAMAEESHGRRGRAVPRWPEAPPPLCTIRPRGSIGASLNKGTKTASRSGGTAARRTPSAIIRWNVACSRR